VFPSISGQFCSPIRYRRVIRGLFFSGRKESGLGRRLRLGLIWIGCHDRCSPVLVPSTGCQSREGLEDRRTGPEEGSLEAFEFPKIGHISRSMSCMHPGLALAKSINFRRCRRCAILLKNGRTTMHLEDCVGCARRLREHFAIFFHAMHGCIKTDHLPGCWYYNVKCYGPCELPAAPPQ